MKFLFSVGAFAHLSVLDTGIQKGAFCWSCDLSQLISLCLGCRPGGAGGGLGEHLRLWEGRDPVWQARPWNDNAPQELF